MARPTALQHRVRHFRIAAATTFATLLLVATAIPAGAVTATLNLTVAVNQATVNQATVNQATVNQATMAYPTDGQNGVDTTQPFTWSTIPQAQGYILVVGSTLYGTDLVNSGILPPTQSSLNVAALPTGLALHATLLTKTNGGWTSYQAITFTAAAGQAAFTNPLDGQTGIDPSAPFTWSTIPQAQGYILAIGTSRYGTNLVNSGPLPPTQSSYAIPVLPAGQTLYATLLTKVNGAWARFQSITVTAARAMDRFSNPVDGQTNVAPAQTFSWSTIAGSQGSILAVGTTRFGTDLVNTGVLPSSQTSFSPPALPTGKTLYATLLTKTDGGFTRFQAISFTTAAVLAHGSLDATFGTGGQVTVESANSAPVSLAFVAGTGQTLVGVLVNNGSGGTTSFIVRLSSMGAIDPTFGAGGRVSLPAGMRLDQVLDAGDGKVLAIGVPEAGTGPDHGMELVRFSATGALDATFGTNGVVTATWGSYLERSAVVAPDGRIFVGADPGTPSTSELGIAAFTSTGAVDTTFGSSGLASTALGGSVNGRVGLALQPNGGLVIAGGVAMPGNPSEAVVARFLASGQPDTAFAVNGVFAKLFGGTGDSLGKIAVAPNGDLVVAGIQFTPTDSAGLIAEITSAGALNTAFGTNGVILENPTLNAFDLVPSVAIGSGGEVYGLLMEGDGPFNGSLRRYTANGQPDATFGSAGAVHLSGVIPMDLVLAYQGRPEISFEVPPSSASVVAERFLT